MDKVIVAGAQQQMRLFDSADGYRRELTRFLNMAHAKGAQLIVFPPLSGVMAASHLVEGFRVGLLKQGSERQRTARSFWNRARAAVADGTASLLGASFRATYAALLESDPDRLAEAYEVAFAEVARSAELTVVAGSAYLPAADGGVRHSAVVYGPDGAELGRHDKVLLSREDEGLATPGDGWHAIDTPAGRLGILFEQEALYPEAGRILAYDGADVFVTLAAAGSDALAAYVRQATQAQAQANRCFAVSAFLVGRNYLAAEEGSAAAFTGKSGIYAPLDMTPRNSGVLVEMGAADAEGLLSAELDHEQLRYLWENGTEPVRKIMPAALFAAVLPGLYAGGRTLQDAWQAGATALSQAEAAPVEPLTEAVTAEEPAASNEAQSVAPPVEPEAQVETLEESVEETDVEGEE